MTLRLLEDYVDVGIRIPANTHLGAICKVGDRLDVDTRGDFSFSRKTAGGAPSATFNKIALTRGQVFRVYFYENGGSRNFEITLGPVDINRAKRLN